MEDEETSKGFENFKKEVLKKHLHRKTKIRNSIGVYDIYKLIRKNKWYDIGRPLKEHEFYSIIRGVNNLLAEEIVKGNTVTFPCKMGSLELRRSNRGAFFKDGSLKVTYPVDWDKTLRLWYNDKEARESKVLVRQENEVIYCVRYCKKNADYNNKTFFSFALNKKVKKKLKENISTGLTDALYEE